jgi:hypothetical protein
MKKLVGLIAIMLFSIALFAAKIDSKNYKEFVDKTFIFVPERPYYKIGDKNFDTKKYSGKELLIKDINTGGGRGVFEIILEETNEKGKAKSIKIKQSYSVLDSLSLEGVEVKEELAQAKEFFVGKALYAEDLGGGNIKDSSNTGTYYYGEKAKKETPYEVKDVVWSNNNVIAFWLMLDDKNYIEAQYANKAPMGFTLKAPKKDGAEKYDIKRGEDKLEKTTWTSISNDLKVEGDDKISIELSQYKTADKKTSLVISVLYYSESWLFIQSAALYVDGVKTNLQIMKSPSDVGSSLVFESFRFNITKQQLSNIANAKSVTLRLSGKKGYVDGEFIAQDFYNFKRFYNEEVK